MSSFSMRLLQSTRRHWMKVGFLPQLNGRKNRPRKIIYFNPPFSINVKTNIGAKFLRIIDECFPKGHPLHKIFNRNTVKISYRCMPNTAKAIARHNSKLLEPRNPSSSDQVCKCQKQGIPECPVGGDCVSKNVVYKAAVTTHSGTEHYTGLTSKTFKTRWKEHNSDFLNRSRKGTLLSTFIWELKDRGEPFSIKWSISDKAPPFNPITKKCRLCLKEKWNIMFRPESATLNRRNEIFATCRHRLTQLLSNA